MTQEVIVNERQISCSGEMDYHPRVYYTINKEGFVVCGYCNIKYIYQNTESEKLQDQLEPIND